MQSDMAMLSGLPFFELLDERERAHLLAGLEVVRLPAGEVVFEYGDPGDALYIIRDGEVEIFVRDDTGTRILLETARAGDVFGEIPMLDSGPRTASASVTRDLEALRLDRDLLQRFLEAHPTAALDLLAVLGRRLRESAERLRHTASRNVNEELSDTRPRLQKAVDWVAQFSGSLPFLLLNALVFFVWIVANVGAIPGLRPFDPFPFQFLTLAVSLEAIFLSTFVLISQNRQAAKDHLRAEIEYNVNLKAELEVAHLHEKVDRLTADVLARLARLEHGGSGPASPRE